MKKLIIPFLVLLIFISCNKTEKEIENIDFIETIYGGCNINDTTNLKTLDLGPDTTYWTLENETLNIFVGFTANCCNHYSSETFIRNDSIFIDINNEGMPICGCICYYTFNYIFEGITEPHYYVVSVEDYWYYYGYVEP